MPPDRRGSLSSQLPGTWRLESRIDVTASGECRPEPSLGEDPIALLARSLRSLRRSVHEARPLRHRARWARWGAEQQPRTGWIRRVLRHVNIRRRAALSPENAGSAARKMAVRGNTLVIELQTTSSDGGEVTCTLTSSRVGLTA
jgi:hypothetical protein